MRPKTKVFDHESLQDADNLAAFLKAIAKGIKKGHIEFTDDDETLTLTPTPLGRFRIKAEKTPKSQTLRIKITWQSGTSEAEETNLLFIDSADAD